MSTSVNQLLSHLRPPFFNHRRTPGPWSWHDFRPGPPQNAQECVGEWETVDRWAEAKYRQSLVDRWTRDEERPEEVLWSLPARVEESPEEVLGSLPDRGSVYQINAKTTGDFEVYKEMETLKKPLKNQRDHLGAYLFVNMSESLLLNLGAKYQMDTDFFRTCFDLSVSHSVSAEDSDHIRITLPFLFTGEKVAGTAPLSNLSFNMLGIYMVRTQEDCTILVWYPPVKDLPGPLVETYNWMAQMSLERQWKDINSDTKDSAFLILPILWWVIYAWCDSIEEIYRYLDWLEEQVLKSPSLRLTQQIHMIRISLLNYKSLLEDFGKTVDFIHSHLDLDLGRKDQTSPERIPTSVGTYNSFNGQGDHHHNTIIIASPSPWGTGWQDPAQYLDGYYQADRKVAVGAPSQIVEQDDQAHDPAPQAVPGIDADGQTSPPGIDAGDPPQGKADKQNQLLAPRNAPALAPRRKKSKQPKDRRFERCCTEIRAEIVMLQKRLDRRNERMKDVMSMVFSHVTIRDSTSMKQIAWVTMCYIPPTFVAGVFGMNVTGIGIGVTTLLEYVWTAIAFTIPTIWMLGMLPESQVETAMWKRIFWPIFLVFQRVQQPLGGPEWQVLRIEVNRRDNDELCFRPPSKSQGKRHISRREARPGIGSIGKSRGSARSQRVPTTAFSEGRRASTVDVLNSRTAVGAT
ncbi:hypothetical protein C8J57DRAFT_1584097 [Mycena rebaudengoi]|nr:hypothetical protein C8J57DRAFT_1584097 [Mycena rebaudengoi]